MYFSYKLLKCEWLVFFCFWACSNIGHDRINITYIVKSWVSIVLFEQRARWLIGRPLVGFVFFFSVVFSVLESLLMFSPGSFQKCLLIRFYPMEEKKLTTWFWTCYENKVSLLFIYFRRQRDNYLGVVRLCKPFHQSCHLSWVLRAADISSMNSPVIPVFSSDCVHLMCPYLLLLACALPTQW